MSVMRYTRKYVLYSLLTLVVICGVMALVSRQIQKGGDEHGHDHRDPEVPEVSSHPGIPPSPHKITPKLKKKPSPKKVHSHDHPDYIPPGGFPPFELPADLQERLDEVSANGNSYDNNPNFFQQVYDAVSNGRDMETTIEILKEYGIYTDVVLEHMDPYEAFIYVLEQAPTDYKAPAAKYAERVFSEDPSSPEGLEAGLYLAGWEERDLWRVLKYHPNSGMVLYRLGYSMQKDKPSESIVYLKKAAQLEPIGTMPLGTTDGELGTTYQYLGDYKSAWVHLKKASAFNSNPWIQHHMDAIARGEPLLLPVKKDPSPDGIGQDTGPAASVDLPVSPPEVFLDAFVVPEEVPASPQSVAGLSPEELARQDAKHQAFIEMLREREEFARRLAEEEQFKADYFREVEAFIRWAESIENDAPIDTNNFLAKEMERHLLGKQTTFDPDRLKRGFEFLNKYGRDEGIKRLQQLDPDLAKQVTQQRNEKRVPPRRNPRDKDK